MFVPLCFKYPNTVDIVAIVRRANYFRFLEFQLLIVYYYSVQLLCCVQKKVKNEKQKLYRISVHEYSFS